LLNVVGRKRRTIKKHPIPAKKKLPLALLVHHLHHLLLMREKILQHIAEATISMEYILETNGMGIMILLLKF